MSVERVRTTSPDLAAANVERIAELFPSVITQALDEEGKAQRAVDFDLLRQELADRVVEGPQERYRLDWPGKRAASFAANGPIAKTLRPVRTESVAFDTTQNLFIEGDNLEVLKLMQESYLGRVQLIYADPPYNTGHDLIYRDDYAETAERYLVRSGQTDERGGGLVANTETNGRFHSDWLSMMYPRLKLARTLLAPAGALAVSIDDTELPRLRQVLDEIFGERNFVGTVVWERAYSPVNLKKHLSPSHDYVLLYARDIERLRPFVLPRDAAATARYKNPDDDPRGAWKSSDLSVGPAVAENIYDIETPSGRVVRPPSGYWWRLSEAKFKGFVGNDRIWFSSDGGAVPSIKRFLTEVKDGVTPMTSWKHGEVGHSQSATQDLKRLFDGQAFFSYPKPVPLMQRLIALMSADFDVVLNRFAGSGTTAHAVMAQNLLDGGSRRFNLMQVAEQLDPASDAALAGYPDIASLSRERVRRAAAQIADSAGPDRFRHDAGFRTLRLDTTNMADVLRTPDDTDQQALLGVSDSVKPGRDAEDLLFEVLINWGMELTMPLEVVEIHGHQVLVVENDSLIACFDKAVSSDLVHAIALRQPLRAVFRDVGFSSDDVRINAEQIFRETSPSTDVKVL